MSDSDSVISLTGEATAEELARRKRRAKLDARAAKKRKGASSAVSLESESDSDSPRSEVWTWDPDAARADSAAWRAEQRRARPAASGAHERDFARKQKREAPSPPSTPEAPRSRSSGYARWAPQPQHFSFEHEAPQSTPRGGRRCLLCGGPLQAVGTARANGVRHHDDWDERPYHKKCWREVKEMQECEQMFMPRARGMQCPDCRRPCSVKTSHSLKNPNRQYYACACKATGNFSTGFVEWVC